MTDRYWDTENVRYRNNHGPDTRCIDGRRWRHIPQNDDPYYEVDVGECENCGGKGCDDDD